MTNQPKVSVIIPTYKRAEFITRAISSVLNQTYNNIEIIVVDDNDCNTEYRNKMEKLMKKYIQKDNFIYHKHKKNLNGATARNTGINLSTGEYITFLDDDDIFISERIAKLVEFLEKNKKYNAVYTATIFMENGKIQKTCSSKKHGNLMFEMLCQESVFCTGSNLFFRAKALKAINGFDTSFYRHQDIEVMVRFFRNNLIGQLNEYLVIKNTDDKSNIPNLEKAIAIRKYFLETFESDINTFDIPNRKKIYSSNYFGLLTLAIKTKKYSQIKEIKKTMKSEYPIELTCKQYIKLFLIFVNNYIPIKKFSISFKKYEQNVPNKIKQEIIKTSSI